MCAPSSLPVNPSALSSVTLSPAVAHRLVDLWDLLWDPQSSTLDELQHLQLARARARAQTHEQFYSRDSSTEIVISISDNEDAMSGPSARSVGTWQYVCSRECA